MTPVQRNSKLAIRERTQSKYPPHGTLKDDNFEERGLVYVSCTIFSTTPRLPSPEVFPVTTAAVLACLFHYLLPAVLRVPSPIGLRSPPLTLPFPISSLLSPGTLKPAARRQHGYRVWLARSLARRTRENPAPSPARVPAPAQHPAADPGLGPVSPFLVVAPSRRDTPNRSGGPDSSRVKTAAEPSADRYPNAVAEPPDCVYRRARCVGTGSLNGHSVAVARDDEEVCPVSGSIHVATV